MALRPLCPHVCRFILLIATVVVATRSSINDGIDLLEPGSALFSGESPEGDQVCDSCRGRGFTDCQTDSHRGCQCDALCEVYGDCCVDTPRCLPTTASRHTLNLPITALECQTLYATRFPTLDQETYWMVSRCPDIRLLRLSEESNIIAQQCTTSSVAPVTDKQTGVIYKNEFCAMCNLISAQSIVRWPFLYSCDGSFKEYLNTEPVDLFFFFGSCRPCRYLVPSSVYGNSSSDLLPPRSCVVHTSTCQPYRNYLLDAGKNHLLNEPTTLSLEEFENAEYHCTHDAYDPITAFTVSNDVFGSTIYRNLHCSLCDGAAIPDSQQCLVYSDNDLCLLTSMQQNTDRFERPEPTFNLLLDINRDGATTLTTTDTVTNTMHMLTACGDREVFDPAQNQCRKVVCPPNYEVSMSRCVQVSSDAGTGFAEPDLPPNRTRVSSDTDVSQNEMSNDDHFTTTIEDSATPTPPCNLTTLITGRDMYTSVGNESLLFEGTTFVIISFDDSHNPVICTPSNLSSDTLVTSHHSRVKTIATGLFTLPSLTVSLLAIVLQFVLRKLYSLYSFVIINLGLALFLSSTLLWSALKAQARVVYFFWHVSSLAVACWLCVILVVHIYLSFRKKAQQQFFRDLKFGQRVTLGCLYACFAWGVPLLIAIINSEVYSQWGPCLNDPFSLCMTVNASIYFFLVPILTAVAICMLVSVIIFLKVLKSLTDKAIVKQFYTFLVLVSTFAVGWLFGFIYLLSPRGLSSAIGFFAFLVVNLIEVLLFFFGLVFTKKLRNTLHKSFSGSKNRVHPVSQAQQQKATMEQATSSVDISDKAQESI